MSRVRTAVAIFAAVVLAVPVETTSAEPSGSRSEPVAATRSSRPYVPPSPLPSVPSSDPRIDEATRRVLELEGEIADITAEQTAIEVRLEVVNLAAIRQEYAVEEADTQLALAREVLSRRIVGIYKSGEGTALSVLLNASSLGDLLARVSMLSRVTALDHRAVSEAAIAAADAAHQAALLDDLRAQDLTLRLLRRGRLDRLRTALEEQQALVATLTSRSRALLEQDRAGRTDSRKAWMDSSVPLTAEVAQEPAVVEPYGDHAYLVAYYQPRRYQTTGRTFTAVCSWYGNEFHGRRTASGQVFNQEDLTCASRTLPFGTRLALTRADRRVVVVVNDRGPFVDGRDLDLSRAAARALGFSGVEPVQAEFVEPLR